MNPSSQIQTSGHLKECSQIPRITFIVKGLINVGKSTLFNAIFSKNISKSSIKRQTMCQTILSEKLHHESNFAEISARIEANNQKNYKKSENGEAIYEIPEVFDNVTCVENFLVRIPGVLYQFIETAGFDDPKTDIANTKWFSSNTKWADILIFITDKEKCMNTLTEQILMRATVDDLVRAYDKGRGKIITLLVVINKVENKDDPEITGSVNQCKDNIERILREKDATHIPLEFSTVSAKTALYYRMFTKNFTLDGMEQQDISGLSELEFGSREGKDLARQPRHEELCERLKERLAEDTTGLRWQADCGIDSFVDSVNRSVFVEGKIGRILVGQLNVHLEDELCNVSQMSVEQCHEQMLKIVTINRTYNAALVDKMLDQPTQTRLEHAQSLIMTKFKQLWTRFKELLVLELNSATELSTALRKLAMINELRVGDMCTTTPAVDMPEPQADATVSSTSTSSSSTSSSSVACNEMMDVTDLPDSQATQIEQTRTDGARPAENVKSNTTRLFSAAEWNSMTVDVIEHIIARKWTSNKCSNQYYYDLSQSVASPAVQSKLLLHYQQALQFTNAILKSEWLQDEDILNLVMVRVVLALVSAMPGHVACLRANVACFRAADTAGKRSVSSCGLLNQGDLGDNKHQLFSGVACFTPPSPGASCSSSSSSSSVAACAVKVELEQHQSPTVFISQLEAVILPFLRVCDHTEVPNKSPIQTEMWRAIINKRISVRQEIPGYTISLREILHRYPRAGEILFFDLYKAIHHPLPTCDDTWAENMRKSCTPYHDAIFNHQQLVSEISLLKYYDSVENQSEECCKRKRVFDIVNC